MKIKIFATGGTLDKIYFDKKNEYQVGEPQIEDVLERGHVRLDYEIESILRKDSLDMTDADRQLIVEKVRVDPCKLILITHGTDTMVQTAKSLQSILGKVIVLTGSLQPARFRGSDADFNIGCAVAALQALPEGVYLCLNGRIWDANKVKKNVELNCFEDL